MVKCRILVVEDERIVALHLQQRLTKLGYEVPAIVASGEQALEKMRSLQPDLVLMDINIEGAMDGIETASHIPDELDIPVIYLTAYSEDATLERARDTKPYGFLVKPFSERALHATIQMVMERRRADLALKESEERLRLALEAADMGSWELDLASGTLVHMGPMDRLFGSAQELFATDWTAFIERVHPEDRAMVSETLDRSIAETGPFQMEFRSLLGGGAMSWLKVQGNIFASRKDVGASRIIGVVQDVTERKNSEQRLRQAATVFEASPDGIIVLDDAFRVITANQSYCTAVGKSLDEVVGKPADLLREEWLEVERRSEIDHALRSVGQWSGEFVGQYGDGERRHLLANVAAVQDGNHVSSHYIAVFSDLTAVRNAEQKLFHLAHHDALTGLPNRLLARERLERALERAKRLRTRVALLFIDLDYFKRVNDSLGHNVGDELLRTLAQRMQTCVRSEDTVSRQGGDEFMVILDHIEDSEDVTVVARKITGVLNEPIRLGDSDVSISSSIGISLFPDHSDNVDDLISAADAAMYVAKDQGRNRYAFYTTEMTVETARHMARDQDLRRGLQQDEFTVFFQPQFCLRTGRMVGVEALIRWIHPQRGLLTADEIIPLAEENGLIMDIGEQVLRETCAQARLWRDAGLPPMRMAVNVSARQMQADGRLVNAVRQALRDYAVPSGQLEIEITESTLQSGNDCLTTLRELKDLGVSLAVDDFGTGYSSLSSLKYLPINRVKIDQSFVRDLERDANDVAITEAIIAMAHRLHLDVVAEGVETLRQEDLLRLRGCDEAQGHLYAQALAPAMLAEYLRNHSIRH